VLLQDYFLATFLASDTSRWTKVYFDPITLRGSRFQPLALTLELLTDTRLADQLISAVYGWNFYAATYLFRRYPGTIRTVAASRDWEYALMASVAERRWDLIRFTSLAAVAELQILATSTAEEFAAARSRQEVLEKVAREPGASDWFPQWKRLFLTPADRSMSDDDLSLLSDPNALVAWTTANVLKRCLVTRNQIGDLRRALTSPLDVLRWRAAHALGAHPDLHTAEQLADRAADDGFRWVRRTSARSLIDMAARGDGELRTNISQKLLSLVRRTSDRDVLREIERSVLLTTPAPEDWARHMGPILDELRSRATSRRRSEQLEMLAYQLRAG